MAEPTRCPDCGQVIEAIVCRGRNPKPMSDEARAALVELLVATHKKMGGCTSDAVFDSIEEDRRDFERRLP